MECSKRYGFIRWDEWDRCVSDSIRDFYLQYSIYPNILLANQHTHSQIDFITTIDENKKNNAHLILDENIEEFLNAISNNGEEINLTSFSNGDCHLIFAIATEPELEDKEFVLLFDDDPDDEDEDDNTPLEPAGSQEKIVFV